MIKALATDAKLDSATAQKVLNLANDQVLAYENEATARWKAARAQDVANIKADKEVGGDRYDASRENAARFLEKFDVDGALFKELKAAGLHSFPALFKVFARAGLSTREDGVVSPAGSGGGTPDPVKDLQRQMYPAMIPPKA